MSPKIRTIWRRFFIEFFKLHREIPGLIVLFTIIVFVFLILMAPTSDKLELQQFVSFTLGVLMPLALSMAGNFIVLKEFETDSIVFVRTRQSIESIWFYRFGFFIFISFVATVLINYFANLIFGEILPTLMTLTIFVPTLLLSSLMTFVTGFSKSAYIGAGAGIAIWLYFFLNVDLLTTRLNINEINYYPFLEWIIYKDRPYLYSSLIPNRLAITAISIAVLMMSYFLYKHNLRFLIASKT